MDNSIGLELMKMFFYVKENMQKNGDDYDVVSFAVVQNVYPNVCTLTSYLVAVEVATLAMSSK